MIKITERTTNEGFKVIYAPEHSNPLVSLHLFVKIGSGWEDQKEAGFSHFTEHLVFKSTRSYPNGNIMERISYLGGSINAYTEYDSTCYFLSIPSKFIREGIKVLMELVRFSDFTEADFNAEKQVILEEISEVNSDPEESLVENVAYSYLPENPYRKSISGNKEEIERAEFSHLKDFLKKHYTPENCFLVCCGDFNQKEVDDELGVLLDGWKKRKQKEKIPYRDGYPNKFQFKNFEHKSNSDMLALAIPDLSESDPDSYPLNMAYKELFSDSRSLLHKELFNRRQLIDGMRMHSITGINDGLSILILFPKENVSPIAVLKAIAETIEDFILRGINAQQLMKNQAELMNAYKYSFEYLESLAGCLGAEEITQGYKHFLEYPENVKKITRLQVRKMIDKWLKTEMLGVYYQGKNPLDEEEVRNIFTFKKSIKKAEIKKDVFIHTLNNGSEIVFKKIKGKPTIGFSASFDVSQLNERKGKRGINQITSGLMTFGSRQLSYEQINELCALHGISIHCRQIPELTLVKGKCFQEDLPLALHTLSGVIFEPKFPREYFNNLRATTVSIIKRFPDYPGKLAGLLFSKMLFGKQSLLINKEGTRGDLNQLTLSQIKNWHSTYYNPENMKLALVGDFDFDNTLKLIDNYFDYPSSQKQKEKRDYTIEPATKRMQIKDTDLEQAVLVLGGFAPSYNDAKEKVAMNLLSIITGGDVNSLLFQELRETHGLAYSVDMDYQPFEEFGYFAVSAMVDRNNIERSLSIIKDLLHKIKCNGVSENELQKVRNHVLGQMLQEQQSMSTISQNIAFCLSMGWGYERYLTRKERLMAVTLEDIKNAAQKYFVEENFYIQVLK